MRSSFEKKEEEEEVILELLVKKKDRNFFNICLIDVYVDNILLVLEN